MRTLLLTSGGMRMESEIIKLLKKPASETKLAHVMTASKVSADRSWLTKHTDKMIAMGLQVEDVDIEGKSEKELEKLLRGRPLRLEKDLEGQDKFSRLVRYVFIQNDDPRVGNIFLNKYMIEHGYAVFDNGVDVRYQGELREAEKVAKTKIVGIWKDCPDVVAKDSSYIADKGIPPPNDRCIIKGNISPNGYGKVYLVPGCPNYDRTAVQPNKGEQYFCTEEEAKKAGYIKANNCN
jgi:micrococcal nuclease